LGVKKAHERGAFLGEWNALVRRARMTAKQKLCALVVSSYADVEGGDIHCGVARLAVDMEVSHRTARRYLAWLREVGLIELVREGNRRRRRSDEYRLTLGPQVFVHLDVPDPERYKVMCSDVAPTDQGSSRVSHDDDDSEADSKPDHGTTMVSHGGRIMGQNEVDQGTHRDVPPPSLNTFPRRSTFPADDEDPRTDVTVDRAVVVELFPGAAQEPPYVRPAGATRAQEVIAEAIARRALARAAHAKEAT
jgi:DNA-binding transcriptional ArsR family regulator